MLFFRRDQRGQSDQKHPIFCTRVSHRTREKENTQVTASERVTSRPANGCLIGTNPTRTHGQNKNKPPQKIKKNHQATISLPYKRIWSADTLYFGNKHVDCFRTLTAGWLLQTCWLEKVETVQTTGSLREEKCAELPKPITHLPSCCCFFF